MLLIILSVSHINVLCIIVFSQMLYLVLFIIRLDLDDSVVEHVNSFHMSDTCYTFQKLFCFRLFVKTISLQVVQCFLTTALFVFYASFSLYNIQNHPVID